MKKILSLAVALMLATLMLSCACAEQTEIADDAALRAVPALDDKQEETVRALSRSDTVEIDGNQYAVVTSEGIGIGYEVTENGVYVLTQDYVRQSDVYSKFYSDPLSAASNFVKNGMHMNIYDAVNDVDLYIYVSTADWATFYPDSEKLTDDSIETLKAYFRRNGFSDADNEVFGTAGNNHYFFYDCHSTEGKVYMYTSVGGYMVRVQYKATTKEQVSRGLDLMDSLTIVTM